jgi:hypothetical protein
MTTESSLQKIFKRIPHIEEEDKCNQENTRKNKSLWIYKVLVNEN